LRRIFAPGEPTKDFTPLVARGAASIVARPPTANLLRSAWRWAAVVGVAAALAWVIAGRIFVLEPLREPAFFPQPLMALYQQAVGNGFEPYYECREDDRFRDVFLRRQGQALTLATLPDRSAMLGLSYPGGMSRNTTAMLCRVDDQPVMVFVDRVGNDFPDAGRGVDARLHVFRQQRDGLVFYEVTPFDAPRMIDYLISPAEKSSGR
jgi:hypothetical protein